MLPETKLATVVRAFFLLRAVADGRRGRGARPRRGGVARGRRARERRRRGRAARPNPSGRRPLRRGRRLLPRPRRPARLRRRLHADGAAARHPDAAPTGRARARRRHGQRSPRAPRGRARRPRDRDGREPARAGVHAPERSAQRADEHRDPHRQPVRARRGRDVRPDHLQRAVRRLARTPLDVPRRRREPRTRSPSASSPSRRPTSPREGSQR